MTRAAQPFERQVRSMRRLLRFETAHCVEWLERRLAPSAVASVMIATIKPGVPEPNGGDDPLPDPAPDPPPYPGDDPPIEYPVLPPSGPIGPGLKL
jgi:hypothetical protein